LEKMRRFHPCYEEQLSKGGSRKVVLLPDGVCSPAGMARRAQRTEMSLLAPRWSLLSTQDPRSRSLPGGMAGRSLTGALSVLPHLLCLGAESGSCRMGLLLPEN